MSTVRHIKKIVHIYFAQLHSMCDMPVSSEKIAVDGVRRCGRGGDWVSSCDSTGMTIFTGTTTNTLVTTLVGLKRNGANANKNPIGPQHQSVPSKSLSLSECVSLSLWLIRSLYSLGRRTQPPRVGTTTTFVCVLVVHEYLVLNAPHVLPHFDDDESVDRWPYQ